MAATATKSTSVRAPGWAIGLPCSTGCVQGCAHCRAHDGTELKPYFTANCNPDDCTAYSFANSQAIIFANSTTDNDSNDDAYTIPDHGTNRNT